MELTLRFSMANLQLFLVFRISNTNLGSEFFMIFKKFQKFKLEDTEPRLLISLTISEDRELSDIWALILP